MTYILFLFIFFSHATAIAAAAAALDDVNIYTNTAGALTINGNPRLDNGNITLSIRERDASVSIAPGTKNLVLNVALDREGKAGPSSVYVNVICVRRHTTDPVSVGRWRNIVQSAFML